MPELPTRVLILQRIINAITVPVETLGEVGHLYEVVGREETSQHGVVEATVHVDESELGQHLMSCIAALEMDSVLRDGLFPPCVIVRLEDGGA